MFSACTPYARPGHPLTTHGFIAGPAVGPGDHYCAHGCCKPLQPLLYTRHVPVTWSWRQDILWRSPEIVHMQLNYVVDEQVLV